MKLAIAAAVVAIANIAAVPYAIEASGNAQDTLIIEHKLSLIDEQSEKASNARHANDFIKNNRSDGL